MPFGLDANDLNLVSYQKDYNDKLVQLLDQARDPEVVVTRREIA